MFATYSFDSCRLFYVHHLQQSQKIDTRRSAPIRACSTVVQFSVTSVSVWSFLHLIAIRNPVFIVTMASSLFRFGLGQCHFMCIAVVLCLIPSPGHSHCSPSRLVLYNVSMKTHWSRDAFPRHFPEFRPPAQWSKVVGRSHNTSYSLFQVGGMASLGLKKFAETSSSEVLDEFSQGSTGICDAFNAPPVTQGVGHTETQFFADGVHSKVSLVSRIVPSPDWFVGIDSVDLCVGSEWIENLVIDVDPLDSGTDNGFTFTSPNWPTLPQEGIYRIYEAQLHPAHSFHTGPTADGGTSSNQIDKFPSMASFTFTKMKEYSLWTSGDILEDGHTEQAHLDELDNNDLGNELNSIVADPRDIDDIMLVKAVKRRRLRKLKGKNNHLGNSGRSLDCAVSEWSEWSECSALCGFGEQHRNRYIVTHPRGTGAACPQQLTDKRLCSSSRDCRQNYFDW